MDDLFNIKVFTSEKQAKDSAKDILKKILQENIVNAESLQASINQVHKYQNSSYRDILGKIQTNITGSQVSAKKIDSIKEDLNAIENILEETNSKWNEITSELKLYGKNLDNIMNSKRNISMMVSNLNIYVDIQEKVKQLEELFKNEDNIVFVYQQIRYIGYYRDVILEKLKPIMIKNSSINKIDTFTKHLECAGTFEDKFYDTFWNYFSTNLLEIAKSKPTFLVKLLRLIEEDPNYMDLIKSQYSPIKTNNKKTSRRKNALNTGNEVYLLESVEKISMENCLFYVEKFIHSRLSIDVPEEFEDLLDFFKKLENEIKAIIKHVVPCFPPKYNIKNMFVSEYINFMCGKVKKFLNEEHLKANPGHLISLATWLEEFTDLLESVDGDKKLLEGLV